MFSFLYRPLIKSGVPCLKTTDQCFTQICQWAQNCEQKLLQEPSYFDTYNGSETGKNILGVLSRASIKGVESLWGDCRFIPGRLGVIVVDLCYFALFEDFSL